MTQTFTPTAAHVNPGTWGSGEQQHDARMELLEALPVRLAEGALEKIRLLAAQGKNPNTIGWRMTIDPLIVELELRRANERDAIPRPFTAEQQQAADEEAALQRLDKRDMNRLARGTHIPNVQLRALIDGMVACDATITRTALLTRAGYASSSHGSRQLGYMTGAGSSRFAQTIRPVDAVRVVRALGVEPREVVGL
ncbi:MAG TPA: hypothetical protein VGL57_13330 [Solirubrobacteraceae bacterium]